jgi:DNA-binding transcriptional MocR family regulator
MATNWTSQSPEVSPRALVTRLGDWTSGGGPLYRRLADRLRAAVEGRELTAGTRLPPERLLARALAVSRTTVVGAYDMLREEAVLESRQGSGTWVRERQETTSSAKPVEAPRLGHSALRGLMSGPSDTIDLLGAHLPGVDSVFATAQSAFQDLQELTREPGYFPFGVPSLRKAVARHLSRSGLPTSDDEVLVTTGAQQAIVLTAAAFLQPGDAVVVEDPTYVGAIDAFRSVGARIVPVVVGPDGAPPAAIREAVVRHNARLVYLMPTFQNPTGAVMPETRRRDVARMAEDLQVHVVEDNTLADLVLSGTPPPPIGAFSHEGPVLSIGSMSKLFWAGLRIGWVRGREASLLRVIQQKVVADMGSSVPSQCLATHLLEQTEKVKRTRRKQVGQALDHVSALVAELLPGWSFVRPTGGLVAWLRLPEGDAGELSQVAARHGVSIVPGPLTSTEGRWSDHIRVPLVPDEKHLREGMERLSRAWKAYRSGARKTREMGVIV